MITRKNTLGCNIIDSKTRRVVRSPGYNYYFNKNTGYFARWGATKEEDPALAVACEIADIEVTTICSGVPREYETGGKRGPSIPCPFCYKANSPCGKNMSFETFKQLFDKINTGVLCQIAFGADSRAESNPDLWKMMEYCRTNDVVPNITVADISDETANKLVKYCGAVSVSRYQNKNVCYDSVKKLTDRGLLQTNIHVLAAEETYSWIIETLSDKLTDPRLAKLNAIVLLSLKKKGRGVGYTPLAADKFKRIIDFARKFRINIGFDSCSAPLVYRAYKGTKEEKEVVQCIEGCESFGLFSSYFDVDAIYHPCSFCENNEKWGKGMDVLSSDFIRDIWQSERINDWRKKMACQESHLRKCPIYDIG